MATAGQDGKVIIWDVAVPPEDKRPPASVATTEGGGDGTEAHNNNSDNNSTSRITDAIDVAPEDASARGEAYLDTESTVSTAPSDDGSRGRGSSESGWAVGGGKGGKEQRFSGSEVRQRRAGRTAYGASGAIGSA